MTRWSIEETAVLDRVYRTGGSAAVAERTGRSETAVRIKASRLNKKCGVKRETPRGKRLLVPGKMRVGALSRSC